MQLSMPHMVIMMTANLIPVVHYTLVVIPGLSLLVIKKQTITADSSTVAEFIAAHLATKEIMWARSMLAELGYPQLDPTILYEDNM